MIRLTKGELPEILRRNARAWTDALLARLRAGEEPTQAERTRYRHEDVKAALLAETKGKCAYCESHVRHVAYGDIEHIVPKSARPELTFEWPNLTLACDVCNTNKSNHFGNHEDLVDPYVVDPADHFDFPGAMVIPKPGSRPGLGTETTLKLNRIELLEKRSERLKNLARQLHLLTEVDPALREILKRDLQENELAEGKEYVAMARAYVSEQLRRIDAMFPPEPPQELAA